MGISTSGSLLIVFFGALVALGTAYTVASNTTDELTDAYGEELASQDEIAETALSAEARYHEVDGNLTVRADNEGSADLAVSETDLLVDGAFRDVGAFGIRTVDDRETDLWAPGEQLRLENASAEPERVKVVTGSGVATTTRVESVTVFAVGTGTLDRTGDGNDSTIAVEVESTYSGDVTLEDVTVEDAGDEPVVIDSGDGLPELNLTREPLLDEPVTADGRFEIGDAISHDPVTLGPEATARYEVGAFRDADDEPVAMSETAVSVSITFEDPHGVERTATVEEEFE